jgi:hypothetical protein
VSEQTQTSTEVKRSAIKEGLLFGFFSAIGTMAAFSMYNHRRQIADTIKSIADAI